MIIALLRRHLFYEKWQTRLNKHAGHVRCLAALAADAEDTTVARMHIRQARGHLCNMAKLIKKMERKEQHNAKHG